MGSCTSDCARYCGQGTKQGETGEFRVDQQTPVLNSNSWNKSVYESAKQRAKSGNEQETKLSPQEELQHRAAVKVQAWWRGHKVRSEVNGLKITRAGSSKYFTQLEARETIDANRKYNPDAQRVKKRPYTFKSKAVYDGYWKGCFRDGKGTQQWPDGAKYVGDWLDNKAHGEGTFYHADGDVYTGQWAYDKANGEGVYTHDNGARYQGNWHEDLQHGFGVETWTDNSKYIGFHEFGSKHGLGIYKWTDNSRYRGEWKENKINGIGRYDWIDERTYTGQWLENNMEGFGIYYWPDGRIYQGQYADDKKHGFGVYSWPDGRKYEGYWTKGKQHGLGTYTVPKDGKLKFGLWEDGKRIIWFSDQQIAQINNREIDYCQFFQEAESTRLCDPNAIFQRPQYFEENLHEVKKLIQQCEDSCNKLTQNQSDSYSSPSKQRSF